MNLNILEARIEQARHALVIAITDCKTLQDENVQQLSEELDELINKHYLLVEK
ncbi:aspartyl-phosphate phosphatase Spo0E family protein [Paenibacillus frigoriresistens]|uniref:Spo0E family sporulation regulatory protein-aspartic acid phosphatase n=1 Tax=Paenibacillus alginolyticus TaxID=59839 RepID=UPI00156789C0|nr:aspartyl-phosphate phosphatase Spo0E family protein [Paenibacillus frigoriresistens]